MNKLAMFRFIFIVMALLFSRSLISQVTITGGASIGLTPQQFVEAYLVGSGITVSNALFNGSAEPLNSPNRLPPDLREQIGNFTSAGAAQQQLGIGGGVILSTGFATEAAAGNPASDDMQGSNQPAESDPDLVILSGNPTINDKSVLEFDFVPQTDVVTFRYVFGSIEFDGFCNSINDAFGLFLSGPGISGGVGFVNDAVNIALLPNSATYVNIFNICEADQGNLGNGIYSWWNQRKDHYSYNRLTYVFTATYSVQCNQTYHMKFAIGDASDGILDSGVFLEQNSFTSNNISSVTSFSNPLTGQLLVEGCNGVSLSYSIPLTQPTNVVIDLAIHPSGTAGQADITPNPFPAQVVIPAGQLNSAPILVNAVADGLPEGTETIVINGTTTNSCGLSNSASATLTIKDYAPLSISMNDVLICDGSSATLEPAISGGQPIVPDNIFKYLWSTADTTASITVSPGPGNHIYSVTVTDACGQTDNETITISVGTTPGSAGPITGSEAICTPASGYLYSIPAIAGADHYVWTVPPGGTITAGEDTPQITVSFDNTTAPGLVKVKGQSTICGEGAEASLMVNINPSAPQPGPIAGPQTVCQGSAVVSYSIDPLNFVSTYEWTIPPGATLISGAGTNQIGCLYGTGATSGTVSVKGWNNDCGFGPPMEISVIVNPLPGPAGNITSAAGNKICTPSVGVIFETAAIPNATSYLWNYTGNNVVISNNSTQASINFPSNATSGILTVTGANACGFGPVSPLISLEVNPRPIVSIPSEINEILTVKNGRPIILRGATPTGTGGVFSGTGVSQNPGGLFIFNPGDNAVTGGGASNSVPYTITYRYTNVFNCTDEKTLVVKVFGSNANAPCPGTVIDVRDNTSYETFQAGIQCWMSENLNYGQFREKSNPQSDNFIPEKYCKNDISTACASSGGFYQWNELMQYSEQPGYQDICMPGWHVPTPAEWETLVDLSLGKGLSGNKLKDISSPTGFHGILTGFNYLNSLWSFTTGSLTGSMYWTSGNISEYSAFARGLNLLNSSTSLYPSAKSNAFSVRCVKN